MSNDNEFFEKAETAREELNKLLKNSAWDKSFLLKKQKDKLLNLLSSYDNALQNLKTDTLQETRGPSVTLEEVEEGDALIYIALYQANGNDITRWQISMHAIESCSFGRPIYESEECVKQLISSNGSNGAKDSDGYVEVIVPENSIIRSSPGRSMLDKLDQPIVNIRPGVLSPERIRRFTHHNDIRYFYSNGQLLLDTIS